jgi:hypothetical protein
MFLTYHLMMAYFIEKCCECKTSDGFLNNNNNNNNNCVWKETSLFLIEFSFLCFFFC